MINLDSALFNHDTIAAIATGGGTAAIAVIRISGPDAIRQCAAFFKPVNPDKSLLSCPGFSQLYGKVYDGDELIDEVIAAVYRAPASFTGDDTIELSCHGSVYIQRRLMDMLIRRGIRPAAPGEFTLRAFANGKIDLAQAEAIADLIEARTATGHRVALKHIRGEYSRKIKQLRDEFIHFASLLELELDFAEEEVEFADRRALIQIMDKLEDEMNKLINSYRIGRVLKEGIPVTIAGRPNVGKSTLLNRLLQEDKALVSDIPGTTRDVIEDTMDIGGFLFRFIDTAGLHHSADPVEKMGMQKTKDKMDEATIILYLADEQGFTADDRQRLKELSGKTIIKIQNKADLLPRADRDALLVSAKNNTGLDRIRETLTKQVEAMHVSEQSIVTSARHVHALKKALEALNEARRGFEEGIPSDLIAIDIKNTKDYLGEITGEITTDDLLGNIFGKFCIGK